MTILSLEPEFIVDPSGVIHQGVLIVSGGNIQSIAAASPPSATRIKLPGKMLLPGFVNVHSHALQRALRGRVEQKSTNGQDNFWSWRTHMYRDVYNASLDDLEAIASLAYLEMLKAGFVAVGEFQYFHHEQSGNPYPEPSAASQRLMKAAEQVGIRQTMLTCAYGRKNHLEKLTREQRRFAFSDAAEFLEFAEHVREAVESPLLNHGIAIHSTRACSRAWIEEIAYSELASSGPLHIHASEQKQEVEESFLEHSLSPIEALHAFGALRTNTTLIHATHLSHRDIDMIAESGAMVGLCPSTERNLGDGLCPIDDLRKAGVSLCIGTDEHVRLDPINELRDIEEQERLRLQRRCIIGDPGHTIAETLMAIGTSNGRRSLGLPRSDDWIGESADLVAIQLPELYDVLGPIAALNNHIVAGSHHDVKDVFVAGRHLLRDGQAIADAPEINRNASEALKRLVKLEN